MDWGYNDDLFELGMNSLQAIRLRRLLLFTLPQNDEYGSALQRVSQDFVYRNPSIASMAEAKGKTLKMTNHLSIEDYVVQYSTTFPRLKGLDAVGKSVVLLTGSTGSLGTYLLSYLSALPSVDQVICLNRISHESARVRQEQAAEAKGVRISQQAWSKIDIIQARSTAPLLGLSVMDYQALRKKVTHILHTAWPMDFKRMLPSFKSQFQTLQNLLDLARDVHAIRPNLQPRLLFVSSISVVGQYGTFNNGSPVPEVPMRDSRCTNPFGYGQAKLVCEQIIENAADAQHGQIQAGYVRVGQIAGSTTTGFWNSDEHFPAMLKSSQHIGRLPNIEGAMSWLPVDFAAESLSQLLLAPLSHAGCLVYHLENPVRQPAQELMAVIASKLGLGDNAFLAMDQWLERICAAADEPREICQELDDTLIPKQVVDPNPAKRLAGFFREDFQHMTRGDVVMDSQIARKTSATLAGMNAIGADVIAKYIIHWKMVGFLT